jgi:glycosyltransferase involved in cell wall biosynthesis
MKLAVACPLGFPAPNRHAARSGPASAVGGGERYPTALAEGLSRITDTDLVVFGQPSRAGFVRLTTVRLHADARPTATIRVHILAAAWLLTSRYVVVHFVQDNELAAATALLSRLRQRGNIYLTPVGGGRRAGLRKLRIADAFAGFLIISQYSRDAYRWLRTTKRPVHGIYGGGDSVAATRGAGGIQGEAPDDAPTDGRRHILFVGRILPHKGVDVLLKALPPDLPAVIAGPAVDAEYYKYLQQIVADRAIDVRFETDADDTRIRELYRVSQ